MSKSLASWGWRVWTGRVQELALEYTSQILIFFMESHGSVFQSQWVTCSTRVGIELTLNWQHKWDLTNMWHMRVHTFNLCGICKVTGLHLALAAPGGLETTWDCREFKGQQHRWTEIKHYQPCKAWKIGLLSCLTKGFVVQLQAELALWAGYWVKVPSQKLSLG